MLVLLQSVSHVEEIPDRKGFPVSEVMKRPVSEGVRNKSNLNKVRFSQQSSNYPSRMPYHGG